MIRVSFAVALSLALLFAVGCTRQSPPAPAADPAPPAGEPPAAGEAPPAEAPDGPGAQPGQGGAPAGDAAAGEGASCGSRGLAPCGAGLFCDFGDNDCGATDRPGKCKVIPEACIEIYQPVCGCDRKTYGNACKAHAAGVDESKYCQPESDG